MDLRNLLGKLDVLSEGSMADAKKKPTGPKHTGKWKGTDPASAAKTKYVGGESLLRDLESALQESPARDLKEEYRQYTRLWCGVCGQSPCNCTHIAEDESPVIARTAQDLTNPPKVMQHRAKRDQEREEQLKYRDIAPRDEDLSEAPAQPTIAGQAPTPDNKPTLGTDLTKPNTQQQKQEDPAQKAAQQKLAQQEKLDQANLQKGVASLKAAGAAVSNPAQVVKAFDKVDDQQPLTPGDKGAVATAGTVLAPIMASPQLQGKFKDLIAQASADEKKQQQMQQTATGGAAGASVPGQK